MRRILGDEEAKAFFQFKRDVEAFTKKLTHRGYRELSGVAQSERDIFFNDLRDLFKKYISGEGEEDRKNYFMALFALESWIKNTCEPLPPDFDITYSLFKEDIGHLNKEKQKKVAEAINVLNSLCSNFIILAFRDNAYKDQVKTLNNIPQFLQLQNIFLDAYILFSRMLGQYAQYQATVGEDTARIIFDQEEKKNYHYQNLKKRLDFIKQKLQEKSERLINPLDKKVWEKIQKYLQELIIGPGHTFESLYHGKTATEYLFQQEKKPDDEMKTINDRINQLNVFHKFLGENINAIGQRKTCFLQGIVFDYVLINTQILQHFEIYKAHSQKTVLVRQASDLKIEDIKDIKEMEENEAEPIDYDIPDTISEPDEDKNGSKQIHEAKTAEQKPAPNEPITASETIACKDPTKKYPWSYRIKAFFKEYILPIASIVLFGCVGGTLVDHGLRMIPELTSFLLGHTLGIVFPIVGHVIGFAVGIVIGAIAHKVLSDRRERREKAESQFTEEILLSLEIENKNAVSERVKDKKYFRLMWDSKNQWQLFGPDKKPIPLSRIDGLEKFLADFTDPLKLTEEVEQCIAKQVVKSLVAYHIFQQKSFFEKFRYYVYLSPKDSATLFGMSVGAAATLAFTVIGPNIPIKPKFIVNIIAVILFIVLFVGIFVFFTFVNNRNSPIKVENSTFLTNEKIPSENQNADLKNTPSQTPIQGVISDMNLQLETQQKKIEILTEELESNKKLVAENATTINFQQAQITELKQTIEDHRSYQNILKKQQEEKTNESKKGRVQAETERSKQRTEEHNAQRDAANAQINERRTITEDVTKIPVGSNDRKVESHSTQSSNNNDQKANKKPTTSRQNSSSTAPTPHSSNLHTVCGSSHRINSNNPETTLPLIRA